MVFNQSADIALRNKEYQNVSQSKNKQTKEIGSYAKYKFDPDVHMLALNYYVKS